MFQADDQMNETEPSHLMEVCNWSRTQLLSLYFDKHWSHQKVIFKAVVVWGGGSVEQRLKDSPAQRRPSERRGSTIILQRTLV
jgi:hypothetical protein